PTPVTDQHEEPVATLCTETLHEPVPALVPAPGADHDLPAAVAILRTRLHLHAQHPFIVVFGDHVDVGAVSYRKPDLVALAVEPLHRGELADVALSSRREASH